jgi:hypothetical protein
MIRKCEICKKGISKTQHFKQGGICEVCVRLKPDKVKNLIERLFDQAFIEKSRGSEWIYEERLDRAVRCLNFFKKYHPDIAAKIFE